MNTLVTEDVKTVSRPEWKYCGWPTMIRCRNGDLMAAYSGGRTHHVCPFGQIHVIRSSDEGRTWSQPLVVVDGPLDDRGAGILETSTGALVVKFFSTAKWQHHFQDMKDGAHSFLTDAEWIHWQAVEHQLDEEIRRKRTGCWTVRSEDGGKTWSAPLPTPAVNAHGPAQLADGRLLYPGRVRPEDFVDDESSRSFAPPPLTVAESDDDGRTWRAISEIAPPEGGKFTEPHAIQAADGRIVMHIRYEVAMTPQEKRDNPEKNIANRAKRFIYQTQSTDGGRTWDAPVKTSIYGFPCYLLALRDGRLLTTFSHRLEPISNQVCISGDHGATWSDPWIVNHNPQSTGDMGYPSTVQLDGPWMLTMWYERLKEQTVAVLKTARWRLDQLP